MGDIMIQLLSFSLSLTIALGNTTHAEACRVHEKGYHSLTSNETLSSCNAVWQLPPNSNESPLADSARPIKEITQSQVSANDIDFFSFEFLRPYLGYEGPNFSEINGEPSIGIEYLVKAKLFAQEAIAAVKFELVNESGRVIHSLRFFKANTSLDDGDYYGLVKVPAVPFRIAISGHSINGVTYRRVHERLFRPLRRLPAPPRVPPGTPSAKAKRIRKILEGEELRARAHLEKELSNNSDGVIVVPRVTLTNVTYEPYLSEKGKPLGIRLRYNVQFSVDGNYAHSLHVYPIDEETDYHSQVDMQVVSEMVAPLPGPLASVHNNVKDDVSNLVQDGRAAWYNANTVYHFVVNLIPDFIIQNAAATKYCIYDQKHKHTARSLKRWDALRESQRLIKYRIMIRQLGYLGETEVFYPLKAFYDSFLNGGASSCKPYGNINF